MNKLEDVKYRELKIIVPEHLYDEVQQICKMLFGKRNYKLRCYEAIVYEFLNNHVDLTVEKGEPLRPGKVYRKKKQVDSENLPVEVKTHDW